jgi:GT2 family glycosyltransferase
MSKVFIVIPVHNRKNITLQCLSNLKKCIDYGNYHIVVIDDGSNDGTSQAIFDEYPKVIVLHGSGDLWWTGAICLGMKYAYEQKADYFFWLNDDTLPSSNALSLMVENCKENPNTIVSAQCYADQELKIPTYGGQKKGFLSLTLFHTPLGETCPCDCMSGNLVCFPRSVIEKIGFPPSDQLPHHQADIVYTWMAKTAGLKLKVMGDATAICEFNPYEEGWSTSKISMLNRWKNLLSYKSNLYPPAFWHYCTKFYGFLGFIIFFHAYFKLILFTIIRLLIPLSILTEIKLMKQKILPSNSLNKFTARQ